MKNEPIDVLNENTKPSAKIKRGMKSEKQNKESEATTRSNKWKDDHAVGEHGMYTLDRVLKGEKVFIDNGGKENTEKFYKFLKIVASGNTRLKALKQSGLSEVDLWMQCSDAKKKEAYNQAIAVMEMNMQMRREDEADRRGVKGWLVDVYDGKGNKVGEKRMFSDRLLEVQLKAGNPRKYVERTETHGVMVGVGLGVKDLLGMVNGKTRGIPRQADEDEEEAQEEHGE